MKSSKISLSILLGLNIFQPIKSMKLASLSNDRTIRIWDLKNIKSQPTILAGDTRAFRLIAFSPDGNKLASPSWDKTVRIWDLKNIKSKPIILKGHTNGLTQSHSALMGLNLLLHPMTERLEYGT